jgi:hypothetical protein
MVQTRGSLKEVRRKESGNRYDSSMDVSSALRFRIEEVPTHFPSFRLVAPPVVQRSTMYVFYLLSRA